MIQKTQNFKFKLKIEIKQVFDDTIEITLIIFILNEWMTCS